MNKLKILIMLICICIGATSALAHVTLNPREAIVGRQTYDIRVPNERAVPTIELRVEVPDGVEVTGIMPVSGWSYSVKRETVAHEENEESEEGHEHESEGRITEIIWSGGRINPSEYMLFPISTLYEGTPKSISWKAYQTYQGGEVVGWVDESGDTPAPKVNILKEARLDALTNSVNEVKTTLNTIKKDQDDEKQTVSSTVLELRNEQQKKLSLNTWLSGAALLLSVVSLVFTFKKRTRK